MAGWDDIPSETSKSTSATGWDSIPSEGGPTSSEPSIPQWMIDNPNLAGVYGAGKALISQAVKPSLEALGGLAGGGAGIAVANPVLGGALGYGAGKKLGEMAEYGYAKLGGEAGTPLSALDESIKSAVDVGGAAIGGKVIEKAAGLTYTLDQKITNAIRKGIEKGIRPTVVGKTTNPMYEEYMVRAESAVKTIIENKPNIKLTTPYGESYEGLPKTLQQFSDSIDQTKRAIFKEYNDLAVKAGEKGVTVNLGGVVKELDVIANDSSIKIAKPEIAKYAARLRDRYAGVGNMGVEDAQKAVSIYNSTLKSFYKNPDYRSSSKAWVDALVVNKMRQGLDESVLNATGQQYQVLKNKYGSLASLEKEVTHRAIVDARKNTKGLIDFSDIFTGYHAVKGLLTLDPATMGASAAGKGLAWMYRLKNNPNRVVKGMFGDVEKLMVKGNMLKLRTSPDVLPDLPTVEESMGVYRYKPQSEILKATRPTPFNPVLRQGEIPPSIVTKGQLYKDTLQAEKQAALNAAFAKQKGQPGEPLIVRKPGILKSTKPMTVEEMMSQLKIKVK